MTKPDLTVLMTVRNGEPYLYEAIVSILNQTYTNFRFLILDNASSDNSRQIARNFNDKRIDLIELPQDLGQTGALNHGLSLIETPFVARIDADDVALPNRLEQQVTYLSQHPETALLGTWCQFIDENGKQTGHFHPPATHVALLDAFMEQNPFAHSTVMFRHGPVQAVGGYPTDYKQAQDHALWLRVSFHHQVANLPEEHTQIREHAGQISYSTEMQVTRRLDAIRNYRLALTHPALSPEARKKGRHTIAKVTLNYAAVLMQRKEWQKALQTAIPVGLRYPHVCLPHLMRQTKRLGQGNVIQVHE